ncbi:hypothetical protein ACFPZ0_20980 [Streptomonospora nanhaiensis]|uniref:Uncharacterized protein n=1 Tax=Streptomonospora nanhaiensis TaxID=1323731 RepID=A0A853BUK6_9ACTN|nr:hypothetical protein [Streptomonospora nanhaiensis]MBV2367163.1 hypothetical protein [Streptomonospora nanhaiensis]MBX9390573.1 hypothetical protein [Streptomonospora nanhaiensis]NYI98181.1 hypothetical protein [Streptomonospora nanhaiensis]
MVQSNRPVSVLAGCGIIVLLLLLFGSCTALFGGLGGGPEAPDPPRPPVTATATVTVSATPRPEDNRDGGGGERGGARDGTAEFQGTVPPAAPEPTAYPEPEPTSTSTAEPDEADGTD